jgi:uncharacterized protein YegL
MNRRAMASVLSIAATALLAPMARASGFIVVDNGMTPTVAMLPGVTMPGRPPHVVRPGMVRPGIMLPGVRPIPPDPHNPTILKGNVSFGLHLQSEEIKVDIVDQVAKTYITQTFANDTDNNLAGTYLFPLPDDTTFSSFSLHIDGKPVEGKILEAQEARQQYEEIVRRMVDPGLLEYADYKTVRARIFPIPAHGTKKVELEYTQVLHADNGMLKYRFPLKAQGDVPPVEQVKVDVKLSSKQGLRTIWSPSHEIASNKLNDNKATVAYLGHDTVPDKDFMLYYSVSDKELAANLLTHKNPGEDGYFLLTLTPPVNAPKVIGKDIVLIADTSGSMQGEKIEETKKALKYIVNALNAEDRFGILQFNTDVDAFKSALRPANVENKREAMSFIDDLEARGGTNIGDALHMGASMLNEVSTRPAYVVMMTDGEPTVGETNVNKLLEGITTKRDLRVFDFGVGYDVNTRLLNKLAEMHHGTSQYVEPGENLETAMSSFYQKIKSPVLSNVKLTFDGVNAKDFYPREVKDIFAGSQVLLIGKYKEGVKGTVHLTGSVNGAAKAYSFPLTFSSDETGNTYLPRLWAMRRIGHLTEVAQDNHENREVIDEIVALSKKYGIISAYTSFLVTDPNESAQRLGHVAWNRRGDGGGLVPPPPPMRVRGSGGGAAAPDEMTAGSSLMRGTGRFNYAAHSNGAKAAFYAAPQQFQMIDDRTTVHDFKEAPASSPVSGSNMSMAKKGVMAAAVPMPSGSPMSEAGKDAVSRSVQMNKLKSSMVADNEESAGGALKSVDDKTFYLVNGFWTDSTYSIKDSAKPQEIAFGSNDYFKLVHDNPGIAKYLGVGKQVILLFKGHCYKITSAVA